MTTASLLHELPATNIEFPEKLQFLWKKLRYKVMKGGRGGTKSWGVARYLICCAYEKYERILCCREFQNSIKESVHQLLKEQIYEMRLEAFFKITDKAISCLLNDSTFIFAGLHNNLQSIKSMEGITKCWVEEAHKVSKESWNILIPTIRVEGSEILVTYNPEEDEDPTHVMFGGKQTPPNCEVVDINWKDNPWLPETLRAEKDYLYEVDPDAAEHVWGGKTMQRSKAQIFGDKYVVREFEPQQHWEGPFYGQDFGFGSDPAATVKMWYDRLEREVFIEKECFGYGVKQDNLPDAILEMMPEAKTAFIRGDCSRPETIVHCQDHGLPGMVGCTKWSGCVEDGINWLRAQRRITIHPRCTHMIDEAKFYRFKVDKLTGAVLPVIVDKHNHGWDGVRYGLEELILVINEQHVVVRTDVQISSDLDDFEMEQLQMGRIA